MPKGTLIYRCVDYRLMGDAGGFEGLRTA